MDKLLYNYVVKRASGVCERCHQHKSSHMCIHHRSCDPTDNTVTNLDYLCASCHRRVHAIIDRKTFCGYRSHNVGRRLKGVYQDDLWDSRYPMNKCQRYERYSGKCYNGEELTPPLIPSLTQQQA